MSYNPISSFQLTRTMWCRLSTTSTVPVITAPRPTCRARAPAPSTPALRQLGSAWLLVTQPSGGYSVVNSFFPSFDLPFSSHHRTYDPTNYAQQAIQHVCLTANDSPNTAGLPAQPCLRIRAETFFPSCWDGVNLDSSDHSSHVSRALSLAKDSALSPSQIDAWSLTTLT